MPDPARARLEVFNVNVTEVEPHSGQRGYGYIIKFWLKETSGTSGATVRRISSTVNGAANDTTDEGCWRERIRVEPGGTLDVFDAGWAALAYCAPYASSALPATAVGVVIEYMDDDSRTGVVDAAAPITR